MKGKNIVRNIRKKEKEDERGISEIVAVVLLIAIAVIAAISIYFWMSGVATRQPTPEKPVPIVANPIPGTNKVLIANLGQKTINANTIQTSGGNITCPPVEVAPGEQVLCEINASGIVAIYGEGTGSTIIQISENEVSAGGTSGTPGGGGGETVSLPLTMPGDLVGSGTDGSNIVLVGSGSIRVFAVNKNTLRGCGREITSFNGYNLSITHSAFFTDFSPPWQIPVANGYAYIPVIATGDDKTEYPAVLKVDLSNCEPVGLGVALEETNVNRIYSISLINGKVVLVIGGTDVITFNTTTMNEISSQLGALRNGIITRDILGNEIALDKGSKSSKTSGIISVSKLAWKSGNWESIGGWELVGLKDYQLFLNGIISILDKTYQSVMMVDLLENKTITVVSSSSYLVIPVSVIRDPSNSDGYYIAIVSMAPEGIDDTHPPHKEYLLHIIGSSVKGITELPTDYTASGNEFTELYWSYPLALNNNKLIYGIWDYPKNDTVNITQLQPYSTEGVEVSVSTKVDNSTILDDKGYPYFKTSCSGFGHLVNSPSPGKCETPPCPGIIYGGVTPINLTFNIPNITLVSKAKISGDLYFRFRGFFNTTRTSVNPPRLIFGVELGTPEEKENSTEYPNYDIDQHAPITYIAFHMTPYGDIMIPDGIGTTTLEEPTQPNTGVLEKCEASSPGPKLILKKG